MTEARTPSKRPARGGLGAGWQSAILAASLGAVLLGWSVLSQVEGPAAGQAAQVSAVQAPATPPRLSADGRVIRVPATPALAPECSAGASVPQRPVFTQPITRSRAS